MHALQQMVPMFFVIQFLVVLAVLVTAMIFADPQYCIPNRKSARRVL